MIKKLFIVANNSWYLYNFRLNLAMSLKNKGYEVYFLAPEDNKYSELLKKDFKFINVFIDSKGINPFKDLKTIYQFYKIYREVKPNIVLNFTIKPNIYSSLVCRYLYIDCISNITGLGTIFIKENFVTKLAKYLYKISLKRNKVVFFQNKDDRDLFLKNNLLCKKSKIDVLPGSGVDLDKFKPITEYKSEKFIFLFIGRLIKDKGIFELIEASLILNKKYDNFKLWLLGEYGVQNNTAITQKDLDKWLKNDFIKYLGKTDDVKSVISKSDCVVLPSYREGTPRSLLEAAAMEKPIVTTNTVGCKEVVNDSINGFLCDVKNSKDLSIKMGKILDLSDDERMLMGKAGRERVILYFDERLVINKYLCEV